MKIQSAKSLKGELSIPGDKSISHRAVMFGALSQGITRITHFLRGADCLSTIDCFRKSGIRIEETPEEILIHGKGLYGLMQPAEELNVGNSGTTLRLISGILAAQPFSCSLTGDSSIQKRPMKRVMEPLSQMGAEIISKNGNGCAPLLIKGRSLSGIHYTSPVASAQVKSAILLAGLYADSHTTVTEPYVSRNHTELMLRSLGAEIQTDGTTVTLSPRPQLKARSIHVPGDISSAAYFIAAGLLVPDSEILIRNVGINPTRDGILRVARAMGGQVQLLNEQTEGEPTADLLVRTSNLKGTIVEGSLIPTLIDEIPIIAVMAACAEGTTIIRDAEELKVKESDRIETIVTNLQAMGADIQPTGDGMIIQGGKPLNGAAISTCKDHRIAMSFAIAGLMARGETSLIDGDCVEISYPGFYEDLNRLRQ